MRLWLRAGRVSLAADWARCTRVGSATLPWEVITYSARSSNLINVRFRITSKVPASSSRLVQKVIFSISLISKCHRTGKTLALLLPNQLKASIGYNPNRQLSFRIFKSTKWTLRPKLLLLRALRADVSSTDPRWVQAYCVVPIYQIFKKQITQAVSSHILTIKVSIWRHKKWKLRKDLCQPSTHLIR